MRTIIIASLVLSCKQMTSEPHREIVSTGKFVTVDKSANKIMVVDKDGNKYPSAVHYVRSKKSYELIEKMSEFGNKLVSPDRILRWEKMLLTYKDGDDEYTCLVSPSEAKSFHDDGSDEQKIAIEAKACETDQQLFTFARLCRKEGGKIITIADIKEGFSSYNGFHIKLLPHNFACVVKRAGKEIPIPSYCFVDKYQSRKTMSSVFKDTGDSSYTDTEHLVKAVFRKIEPYINQVNAPARKSCRHGRRIHNIHKIGYQYKVGAGEEIEEVSQTEEMQQSDAGDNE